MGVCLFTPNSDALQSCAHRFIFLDEFANNLFPDRRGKFQGIIGVVVAFGYAVGPILGGALAQKVNWRVRAFLLRPCVVLIRKCLIVESHQWCFWIEPPVALSATTVVMLVLPLKKVEGNFRRCAYTYTKRRMADKR